MIVNDLKKSILQYALSGKLCEQNNNDTLVDEMILSINNQKKGLKSRLNKFETSINQEIPFSIPETWKWVELKDISLDIYAGGDKPKKFSENETPDCSIPVIANGETNDGIVGYTDQATENEPALTVAGRGTIGFSKYRTSPFTPIVRLIVIKLPKEISYQYLQRVFEFLIEGGVGTSIKQLTVPMIVNKYIPLPPIEEQKRIVEKIDFIFEKLDEILSIENDLIVLKKNFSADMRKSILNAILSKYDSFIDLNNIAVINGGYSFKSVNYCNDGIRIIRISDFDENGIKDDNIVRYKYDSSLSPYKLENNNIIICMTGGTVGKNIILDNIPDDYYTNQRVATIKVNENFIPKFVYYCINAPFIQKMIQNSKNSTNDNISMSLIKTFPIPNISMEEQNNVIKQIEQFLPLCEEINCLVNEV